MADDDHQRGLNGHLIDEETTRRLRAMRPGGDQALNLRSVLGARGADQISQNDTLHWRARFRGLRFFAH